MFKIGDTVKIGDITGNVINIYKDKSIGFLAEGKRKETVYDIGLYNVPEEQMTLIESSEDTENGSS